jgi:hypothetical protein
VNPKTSQLFMLKCQGQFQFWRVIGVMATFLPSACLPTTIVAIRTPETLAIAADTAGTFKGGGKPNNERPVSKIFQNGSTLFAVAGLSKDSSRGYDPAKIIDDCLKNSQSVKSAVTNVERILSKALSEMLSRLQIDEPTLFRDATEGDTAGTTILLAAFENGQPVAIGVRFVGKLDGAGKIIIVITRFACPGDCPDGEYTFFLGQRKAIERYVAKHGKDFAMSPEEGARFMVQLEIDAKTPGVGPPIDIVRLNKNGIRWISEQARKEEFPKPNNEIPR